MKALSLHQPFASLVAQGRKTIETRRWRTSHRGRLLICSSLTLDPTWEAWKPTHKPILGQALAIVTLVECRPMTHEDEDAACCGLYHGAVAWILDDLTQIEWFPVRGYPGIFNVTAEIRPIGATS